MSFNDGEGSQPPLSDGPGEKKQRPTTPRTPAQSQSFVAKLPSLVIPATNDGDERESVSISVAPTPKDHVAFPAPEAFSLFPPEDYIEQAPEDKKQAEVEENVSLVPYYAETPEQIAKTITSLVKNQYEPHQQLIVLISDGKPPVDQLFEKVLPRGRFAMPYLSWKGDRGTLRVTAGFLANNIPAILLWKVKNSGKKDSLIVGNDIFNFPRDDMPKSTQILRKRIRSLFPALGLPTKDPEYIFCTDADTIIDKKSLAVLVGRLERQEEAVACAGLVAVDFEGAEWSVFNLFQNFQYLYGQYVRRRGESFIGKVTCLPGAITMFKCNPHAAGAISMYAELPQQANLILHQVQFLGTDRRLTTSVLTQNYHDKIIFEPRAACRTIPPATITHYLSQRRRWGSNSFFNTGYNVFLPNMWLVTRIIGLIDLLRQSLIYFRIFSTVLFLVEISTKKFVLISIIPTLVVAEFPVIYFIIYAMLDKRLRSQWFKIAAGLALNRVMTAFLSITVFTLVIKNAGAFAWGMTGGRAATNAENKAAAEEADDLYGDFQEEEAEHKIKRAMSRSSKASSRLRKRSMKSAVGADGALKRMHSVREQPSGAAVLRSPRSPDVEKSAAF
ncbi:hypothetical protein HDU87_007301 [Geranomyces variabilis]|uniref:chitin synthase n=1 Tax=Geranomyces variabilis TaxID=109894 RepID=A0AAD5TE44_9FUNG|nr:hypothetical protein HDU87_007301 [Geranomyces variabilis]